MLVHGKTRRAKNTESNVVKTLTDSDRPTNPLSHRPARTPCTLRANTHTKCVLHVLTLFHTFIYIFFILFHSTSALCILENKTHTRQKKPNSHGRARKHTRTHLPASHTAASLVLVIKLYYMLARHKTGVEHTQAHTIPEPPVGRQ